MMQFSRRRFLQLTTSVAGVGAATRNARGQSYPTRPVHIIVGFPPGQAADISARLLGQWLSERLGQSFIIDNRPGAASTIATEQVVHASPDGYTLLYVVASNYINATLKANLPYNFIRDIEPVASITRSSLVVEVVRLPSKTLRQCGHVQPPVPMNEPAHAGARCARGHRLDADNLSLDRSIDQSKRREH